MRTPTFPALLFSLGTGFAQPSAAPSPSPSPLEQRALAGDTAAMTDLAREFLNGAGRPQDPVKAMDWFLKGAQAGNAAAQVGVGYLLNGGIGCGVNKTAAADWFRRAAEQGNSKGQHNLAVLLREGVQGPVHMPEALAWFEKAAAQGMMESQALLGEMYYQAVEGVPRDFFKAAVWLEKAAANGHNPSRTVYGSMLRFGNAVPVDEPRALALFQAAAQAGYAKAMCQLADMLAGGEGTERQPVRAAAWYFKAASLNEASGKTGWESLRKTLTPDQEAEAKRLAPGL